jgi:hypothetical protein
LLADLKKSSGKKTPSEDNHMIVEVDGDNAQEAPLALRTLFW